ncbi:Mg2+ transporter protein- CorA-like/Zinc transport protein ZntB [Apiospora marii]|uniref:Mg2+ transporter protein- CorA-like/Zinc transport protein ZntB n=1 Tax=Apiospora marii TaxID=335849 RepID=UPI0031302281
MRAGSVRGTSASADKSRDESSSAWSEDSETSTEDWDSSSLGSDDYEEVDGVEGKVFSFRPTRAPPAEIASESELETAGGQINMGTSDAHQTEMRNVRIDGPPPKSSMLKTLDVFASDYTGDFFIEGTHSAKLTTIHDTRKQHHPLFRWMHLSQPILDLDTMSAEIVRVAGLGSAELYALAKLFTQIKREAVKARRTTEGDTVRHMEPKSISVPIPTDDSQPLARGGGSTSSQRYMTWVCLPYFSLETYGGPLSAESNTLFPIETLLQSQYTRTTATRETQQVHYRSNPTSGDKCYHIAQLWCIIVDKSLLVTCGRMPSASLRENIISISPEPPAESPPRSKMIYVSYYDNVMWSFSLEDCSTWFGFIKHFHAFWPRPIGFFHRDKVVTEEDWPRILYTCRHANSPVTLALRFCSLSSPRAPGSLQPLETVVSHASEKTKQGTYVPGSSGSAITKTVSELFHVFTWLDDVQLEPGSSSAGESAIQQSLGEVDGYLASSTKLQEKSAYKRCNHSTRQTVHAYLEGQSQAIGSQGDDERSKDYSQRVDIYNAAELVFQFFLPVSVDQDVPTVGKYWGAVQKLVEMPQPPPVDPGDEDEPRAKSKRSHPKGMVSQSVLSEVRNMLRGLSRIIVYFQGIMKHVPAADRRALFIPDTLVLAWMHLLMALVMSLHEIEGWDENLGVFGELTIKGSMDVMSTLPRVDLRKHTAMQPLQLVSLLGLKLFQDSTDGNQTLSDIYAEYIKDLDNEIRVSPSRSHQSRIGWLLEEIAIIMDVIATQRQIVSGLQSRPGRPTQLKRVEAGLLQTVGSKHDTPEYDALDITAHQRSRFHSSTHHVRPHSTAHHVSRQVEPVIGSTEPDDISKLSPTDPNGLLGLLLGDCKYWVDKRTREFSEMRTEAARLEAMNVTRIDTTKDRQEAAVYAFTMVTIVFLPLGTISSIFGMNTSDIANLESGQWVYWATAIPVTVLVIIIGLWWMGELRSLVEWLLGRRYKRSGTDYRHVALATPPPPSGPHVFTWPPSTSGGTAAWWDSSTDGSTLYKSCREAASTIGDYAWDAFMETNREPLGYVKKMTWAKYQDVGSDLL